MIRFLARWARPVIVPVLGLVVLAVIGLFTAALADDTPTQAIVSAACANNGALLAYVVGAIVGAKLLTNLKFVHTIPALGFIVNIVALNWRSWLRQAVVAAAKTGPVILLLIGFGFVVAACTAPQLQTASTDLQLACQGIQTDLALAQAGTGGGANKTVQSLASYANGACPLANGVVTVAANLAANSDGNSLAWLQGLDADLKAVSTTPAPATAPAPATTSS
jgi:hypothetical protein